MMPVPACASCLDQNCCEAIDACSADPACLSCLAPDGYCASTDAYTALSACVHQRCGDECYPVAVDEVPTGVTGFLGDLTPGPGDCVPPSAAIRCNPTIPSQTCNWEAGTACDFTPRKNEPAAKGFDCYLSHRKHINEQCGLVEGLCHFGLTCVNAHSASPNEPDGYRCLRFCCHDTDCGPGICDTTFVDQKYGGEQPPGQSLGICVKAPGP